MEHHIQKKIVYHLITHSQARFSELKPKNMDSNVFTYHLKQLITHGLVSKDPNGMYILTPLGKVAGINVTLNKNELLIQAHSVLFLALHTEENGWLMRKRLVEPMYGRSGFPHCEPLATEDIEETASKIFKEKTGLDADFIPKGSGYIRLFLGKELESYVHFTFMYANSYSGEPVTTTPHGENYWYQGSFTEEDFIASMKDIIKAHQDNQDYFFLDKSYTR